MGEGRAGYVCMQELSTKEEEKKMQNGGNVGW